MKIVNLFKNLVSRTANEELAKYDAHLLADIGVKTTFHRTTSMNIPADLGLRLI